MERLIDYLKFTRPVGDCLEWTRCLNTDGYPRAYIKGSYNGKVHREVFFLTHGYYPPVVRHSCDNPRCINPEHLVAGDQLDNIQDRVTRGRSHRHVSQELLEEIILLRKSGMSHKDIATKVGRTVKSVDYALNERGKVKG